MKYLSNFGREYFWSLVIIMLILFGKKDERITAIIVILSIVILIPVNILVKDSVDRERPSTINNEFDGSYPSGHASIVAAGALVFTLFLNSTWERKMISIFIIIEAALVCVSRLYVGSHYPTDVIGGILLGSGVVLMISNYRKSLEIFLIYVYNRLQNST